MWKATTGIKACFWAEQGMCQGSWVLFKEVSLVECCLGEQALDPRRRWERSVLPSSGGDLKTRGPQKHCLKRCSVVLRDCLYLCRGQLMLDVARVLQCKRLSPLDCEFPAVHKSWSDFFFSPPAWKSWLFSHRKHDNSKNYLPNFFLGASQFSFSCCRSHLEISNKILQVFKEWRPFLQNFVCVFPQRLVSACLCFRLSQHGLGEAPLGEGVGTMDTAW